MIVYVPDELKPHANKVFDYLDAATHRKDPGLCFDCKLPTTSYHVIADVWKSAVPNHAVLRALIQSEGWNRLRHNESFSRKFIAALGLHLCLRCLEARLGRRIALEDLVAHPINYNLRVAFEAGRASAAENKDAAR